MTRSHFLFHKAVWKYTILEIHLATSWKLDLCFPYSPLEFFAISFNDFEKGQPGKWKHQFS